MFCTKCGTGLPEDSGFCHKCGAKVVYADTTAQSVLTVEQLQQMPAVPIQMAVPPMVATQQTDTETSVNTVELVVTGVKLKGPAFMHGNLDILIDGTKIGELSNGGRSTYKIIPGQHTVKIVRSSIWIDVPNGNAPITLKWQWGENDHPEIVCNQADLVTKPSETEKMNIQALLKSLNSIGKAGLGCIVLGAIGIIVGFLLFPSFSGSYVSAEQHLAVSEAMEFAALFLIGGFVLAIIGAVIITFSSRKAKK